MRKWLVLTVAALFIVVGVGTAFADVDVKATIDKTKDIQIKELILKLKESRQVTIVIVTHDVGSALRLADSVAMLHEGVIVETGTPEAIQQSRSPLVQQFIRGELDGPIRAT